MGFIIDDEDGDETVLEHYGTPRHSGRWEWGSTNNVPGSEDDSHMPRNPSWLDNVADLKRQGLTDTEIAQGMGMSTTQFRARKSIEKNAEKQAQIAMAERLSRKGMSNVAAAARMGIPESSYRALLKPGAKLKADMLLGTANALEEHVKAKQWVDVGSGVENYLGISKEKLNTALAVLKERGYEIHQVKIKQIGTGHETQMRILSMPGTTQKDAFLNRSEIQQVTQFSPDGGENWVPTKYHPPLAIDPSRIQVKYASDGGADADGVIYVRPGVKDVSLGGAKYAQVRVAVEGGRYLKGMAVYKDDLPDGVDLVFNTNKEDTGDPMDAMKKLTDDPLLPFGSVTRPLLENEHTDDERPYSAMNIVNTEGKWKDWSKTISTQVLSKQSPTLVRDQLSLTMERRQSEFEEINALTNPTVRRKLLEEFADGTDAAAVHLDAAALPRQNWHVILPDPDLKPDEIYAPGYRDGERVALIRYPHGGKFEIPELTVNNKQASSREMLGTNPPDAVAIHPSVAERLSGADFDGDTVLVIPNNGRNPKIKSEPALEGLKNFNPREAYPKYEGMPVMSKERKQMEMGDISNLITDMSLRLAPNDELARAVRHSMVVIDAEKHELNYRQSARDNGIAALKQKYQKKATGGASTLISKATSPVYLPDRKERPQSEGGPVDRETGARVFVPSGKKTRDKDGNPVDKLTRYDKLAVADDAHDLSSGTPIENMYADHSNALKALANRARLQAINTPPLKRVPNAAKAYEDEVRSLTDKLDLAYRNKPRERQAQVLATNNARARRAANPDMEKDTYKKIQYQALNDAREAMGARKQRIKITPKEWEAIQAGAVSNSMLNNILMNADMDKVRELATPRTQTLMTPAKSARARQLLANGATRAQVADMLGVSLSTLDRSTSLKQEDTDDQVIGGEEHERDAVNA